MIERSVAIKCPTIAYHLAGAKKIQQVLALPGAVERFIDDPITQRQIRDTFAGLYSLDLVGFSLITECKNRNKIKLLTNKALYLHVV